MIYYSFSYIKLLVFKFNHKLGPLNNMRLEILFTGKKALGTLFETGYFSPVGTLGRRFELLRCEHQWFSRPPPWAGLGYPSIDMCCEKFNQRRFYKGLGVIKTLLIREGINE